MLESGIYVIPFQSYDCSDSTTLEAKHSRKMHLKFKFSIHHNANYVYSNSHNF